MSTSIKRLRRNFEFAIPITKNSFTIFNFFVFLQPKWKKRELSPIYGWFQANKNAFATLKSWLNLLTCMNVYGLGDFFI